MTHGDVYQEKSLFELVRSKQKVRLSIIILFLFFQIVPLAVRNAAASVMPWMIASGGLHSIAMKTTGTVWTWGNNMYGQLGDGTATDSKVPVYVSSISNAISVAGGFWHTVALKSDGTVWTWGNNTYGQLGNGTNIHSDTPVQVSNLTDVDTNVDNVTSIAGGYWHSLALKTDGTAVAWGNNYYGQLGDGSIIDSNVPVSVDVDKIRNLLAIAGGGGHPCA